MKVLIFVTVFLIGNYHTLADDPVLIDETYVLNFDSPIYVCPDDKSQMFVDTSAVEVKRYNETTSYMSGSIKFLKGIETETMLELLIERYIGGRIEMFSSHEICDFCKELGDQASPYMEHLKYLGLPENCPVSPNTFAIQDFVPNTNDLPVNSATAGRYQLTINFYKNHERNCLNAKIFMGCLVFDFIIEAI